MAGALAFSACAPVPSPQQSDLDTDTTVSVMWNQPMYTMNAVTNFGNATANHNIIYLTRDNFIYYDKDLNLVQNKSYGSYEKLSDDPLKIKLTMADTALWSDGVPVDAADMVLGWASTSSVYNTVKDSDEIKALQNEDGSLKPVADGKVYFNSNINGINLIKEFPEISEDGKSATFTFSVPFADWENDLTYFGASLPAHIVAKRALGTADPTAAKAALLKAFQDKDAASLSKIANVWNQDWNYTKMPEEAELVVGSGAYNITEYKEKQYITLTKNPQYKGELTAPTDIMTIRYNEDPMANVQALQNDEVQLISPQPTADVLTALNALKDVTVISGDEATYEHIDLTFDNGGPFDPKTYNKDAAKALKVRQAFLKTIPRQEIVDKIIKPLNPNAEVRNSFNLVPGSSNYADTTAANGMSTQYDQVDIEGAKALLADAGVKAPKVRILYGKSNVRRQQEFSLIKESAEQAGFEVIDNGDDNWGAKLGDGTYDASIFGWQTVSPAATEPAANFIMTEDGPGLNNLSGYNNKKINELYAELNVTIDTARQKAINEEVEKILVDDAFGLTLYQFPGATAFSKTLSGVDPITISPTIFWNFWTWKLT
jgi:peptide/nickel transport system substrate-binding protein